MDYISIQYKQQQFIRCIDSEKNVATFVLDKLLDNCQAHEAYLCFVFYVNIIEYFQKPCLKCLRKLEKTIKSSGKLMREPSDKYIKESTSRPTSKLPSNLNNLIPNILNYSMNANYITTSITTPLSSTKESPTSTTVLLKVDNSISRRL